jgi:Ca-activated chloride channel family protein
MTFLWPAGLCTLLLVPFVVAFYLLMQRRRRTYSLRFTNVMLLERVVGKGPGLRRYIPPVLFLCALTLLLLGLARPVAAVSVPRNQAAVALVVDTSGSMVAADMQPSRMIAARQAAHTFVNLLPPSFLVSLVSFSSNVTVRAPMTRDHALVQRAIDTLTPDGGTAIGDGLTMALEQMKQLPVAADGKRIPATIVLLSDGQNNMGISPVLVAAQARAAGIRVNTIGIGERGVLTLIDGSQSVGLDESTLQEIASATGGRYFYAARSTALQQIYADLSAQMIWMKESVEISAEVSAVGILFLLMGIFLSIYWFQRAL